MGRTKKEVVLEPSIVSVEVADLSKNTAMRIVAENPVEKPKATKVVVTASCKTRTVEGDRIVHKYRGEGASLTEALDSVVGSDEDLVDEYGKPFPKNININVVVKITKGDYSYELSLAPHVAKDILENKNVALATKRFGL